MDQYRTHPVHPSQPRTDVRLTFPDGSIYAAPLGTALEDFVTAWQAAATCSPPVTAVAIGEVIYELSHKPERDAEVVPLDLGHIDGMRIYKRSLSLVLVAAAHNLFPESFISIDHSVTANGFFCEVGGRAPLSPQEVEALDMEMHRLVQADMPIVRKRIPLEQAVSTFAAQGYQDKLRVLRFHHSPELDVYELDGIVDSFYGHMVTHTGCLQRFRLHHHESGFTLTFPLSEDPNRFPDETDFPKLMHQFREGHRWLATVGAENVGDLNAAIEDGSIRELILTAEALHERRIAEIATQIAEREGVRIVFISGPSSSGKTTFAKRLGIQLGANGLRSFAVSLDDYFVERELTPRDEAGQLDFEAFEAIDHALFTQDMSRLLAGETVTLPRYDFLTGTRVAGPHIALSPGMVLLVEGLHGLNPNLLHGVPRNALFKVYVSPLSQLNIDHHNYVPTSDGRLVRRIVRDALSRGYTAEQTIERWHSVRRGERRYIFPYQEEADVMFNSGLAYEMSVLKPLAEPLLLRCDHGSPAALESRRLLTLLSFFLPIATELVPDNSILREFIGGSIFEHLRLVGSSRT